MTSINIMILGGLAAAAGAVGMVLGFGFEGATLSSFSILFFITSHKWRKLVK